MSPRNTAIPIAALFATFTLSACNADADTSLTAPSDPIHAITVAPSLLAALGDARERVLPTLDAEIQTPLAGVLIELQSALDAGQLTRSRRAIASARALLAAHAGVSDSDLADLASVGVVLIAADDAVRQEQ